MPVLNSAITAIFNWLYYLLHPVDCANALLRDKPDALFGPKLIGIWSVSLSVNIVISLPVLQFFGISIADVSFLLTYQLTWIAGNVVAAFAIHKTLQMYKQSSHLGDTMRIYSIIVIYTPMIQFLSLPKLYHAYVVYRWLKSSGLNLIDAAKQLGQNMSQLGDANITELGNITNYVALLLVSVMLAVAAECLAQWYKNKRYETYAAAAVGMILYSLIYITLILPLDAVNAMAHIQ